MNSQNEKVILEKPPVQNAFWISPNGKTLTVTHSTHIKKVCENPVGFGLQENALKAAFDKYNEPYGFEGYAREAIIKMLIHNGFIRIREYYRPNAYWSVNISRLNRRTKDYIKQLAKIIYDSRHSFHEEFIITQPEKPEIRLTLLEILMDRLEKDFLKPLPDRIFMLKNVDSFSPGQKPQRQKRFSENWSIAPKTPEELFHRSFLKIQPFASNAETPKKPSPDLNEIEKSLDYKQELTKLRKELAAYRGKKWSFNGKNWQLCHILLKKWKSKTGINCFGIGEISGRLPAEWLDFIDRALDFIQRYDPDFEIHQIKIKFGELRFYVETALDLEDFKNEISQAFYAEG